MDGFFGRSNELQRLGAALTRAEQGQGSLVVLTGEAGIGKSRLAKELEGRARERHVAVAWGRCWEAGGAPAFWPWTQVFRALERNPFGQLTPNPDPNQRFVLFDAAARTLAEAARETPRLVLLDDLHVADVPSLLLLLFVARELSGMSVLVVGSVREAHPTAPEKAALLAKIRREGEVFPLPRLTPAEVTAWAVSRSTVEAERLFGLSEGNPLFVEELLRVGLGKAAFQGSLGPVIDEHVSRVSARARLVLDSASVLGREFALDTLCKAFGFHADDLAQDASEAIAAGVLVSVERGGFAFSHALLRDRLYESLPPTRRAELHWQAGLAMSEGVPRAHHLLEGRSAGDPQVAAVAAHRAAAAALAQLAFEEAIVVTERARSVVASGSALECELELVRAEALFGTGKGNEGRTLSRQVAALANALQSPELMARAALVYGTDFVSAAIDPVMVELLETALAHLPAEPSALRVRVTARLSAALTPPVAAAEAARVVDLAREALAMAQNLGDKEAILHSCALASGAIGYLVGLEERAALVAEAMTLARELDRPLLLEHLSGVHVVLLVEQGRRAEANVELRAFEELTARLPRTHRGRLLALQSLLALLDHRLEDAKRLSDESRAHGSPGSPNESVWALQRMAIAVASGDPRSIAGDADELLEVGARKRGTVIPAWILAAAGRSMEATTLLETSLSWEPHFPEVLWIAGACVLLENRTLGGRTYPALAAEVAENAVYWGPGGGTLFGPTSLVAGDLALLLGLREEASAHYDQAIALCQRMSAKPFLELALRGRAACGARSAAPRSEPRRDELSLRREGEVWVIQFGTSTVRLKDGKGLTYLHQLVLHSGRELHVLVLVGAEHAGGDAGAILDAQAKAEYHKRVELLDDRIELARSLGDERGVERARSELDAVAEQLATAVGLGGRDRHAASNVERARINVQRRLKDTIANIAAVDAPLGRFLKATVKTGTFCSFIPL